MIIGIRIRQLRERKGLSQGDVQTRTGLLRTCVSRLENGHRVPSLDILERLSEALEVPLYQLFYAEQVPTNHGLTEPEASREELALKSGGQVSDRQFVDEMMDLFTEMTVSDREAFLGFVERLIKSERN